LSWRILLLAGRHGVSCARPGAASRGGGVEVARSRVVRVGIRGCHWHEAVQGTLVGVAVSRRRILPQRRVWWCSARDGRTGLMATKVTAPTGLTSRRHPVRAWSSRAPSLQGFRRPFSRVWCAGRTGVGSTVPRGGCWPRRTTSNSDRDGRATGVGGAVPGHDSQARSDVDSPLTWHLQMSVH
jgi:hypothetical protein